MVHTLQLHSTVLNLRLLQSVEGGCGHHVIGQAGRVRACNACLGEAFIGHVEGGGGLVEVDPVLLTQEAE